MAYLPYDIISYALADTPSLTIDFSEFKSDVSGILLLHEDFSKWTAAPWRETYRLSVVVRDADFTTMVSLKGTVENMLNKLPGTVTSDYEYIGIDISDGGEGFSDEFHYTIINCEVSVNNIAKK